MHLLLHERYTETTLSDFDLERGIKDGILSGSVANDLCSLTTEFRWLKHIKNYWKDKESKKIIDYSSLYQSHLGKLSALHCMAHKLGESPDETKNNVIRWLQLLESISRNNDPSILSSELSSLKDHLGPTVADLHFKVSDVLDTKKIALAQVRAIGMILHIIQDSYTKSHCFRNEKTDEIMTFYGYHEQSMIAHANNDVVMEGRDEILKKTLKYVLTSLLNNQKIDYSSIIKISAYALPSNPGVYV